jgi:hypothetical protein
MTEMLSYGGERLDGPGGAPSHWPGEPDPVTGLRPVRAYSPSWYVQYFDNDFPPGSKAPAWSSKHLQVYRWAGSLMRSKAKVWKIPRPDPRWKPKMAKARNDGFERRKQNVEGYAMEMLRPGRKD